MNRESESETVKMGIDFDEPSFEVSVENEDGEEKIKSEPDRNGHFKSDAVREVLKKLDEKTGRKSIPP